jgi:hypothetical protein
MISPVTSHKPAEGKNLRKSARDSARWIWAAFLASAAICIALFFIPAFVIRPFRYQAPRALWLAMGLRQRAPLGTLVAACACAVFAFILWRNLRRWQKALLVLALIPVAFSVVMARLNYFEWMFHPIDRAQFLPQSRSKLDAKEMVMAIRFGDEARAYPISEMAYHHVLNDEVGGVPVAATY